MQRRDLPSSRQDRSLLSTFLSRPHAARGTIEDENRTATRPETLEAASYGTAPGELDAASSGMYCIPTSLQDCRRGRGGEYSAWRSRRCRRSASRRLALVAHGSTGSAAEYVRTRTSAALRLVFRSRAAPGTIEDENGAQPVTSPPYPVRATRNQQPVSGQIPPPMCLWVDHIAPAVRR